MVPYEPLREGAWQNPANNESSGYATKSAPRIG
jgi:hypothetical protein